MRGNSDENLKVRDKHKVVILAIIAGLFAYTIDAAVDSFIFHDGPFLDVLIFASFGEVCIRLYILASFIMFGIFISTLLTKRKQTEETLRESEARYRNLVETAPVVIYALTEDGTITSLNPAFEKITGWSTGEVMGKSFASIIHPDDLPLAIETFQKTLHGETPSPYELRVISKSGECLVGEFTSTPQTKNGKIVGEFGVVRDITERKKAEEELRFLKEFNEKIIDSLGDALLVIDPFNYAIISFNEAALKQLKVKKEDLIGEKCYETTHHRATPCTPPHDVCPIQEMLKTGKPATVEHQHFDKDNNMISVEVSAYPVRNQEGNIVQVVYLAKNITERRIMEKRLSTLNFYGGKLNVAHNLQQVYELTLDAMEKTLGFENASFMIRERDNLKIVCQRGYLKPIPNELPVDEAKKSIAVKAANTRKPILVPDVKKEKDYVEGVSGVQSRLAVPVLGEDEVLGILSVESRKLEAFDEKDVVLLQILASHAATAICNLVKREEIEKRSSQMTSLMKSSAETIHSMGLRQRLETIAEAIHELGWRRVVISARDENLDIAKREDIVTAGLNEEEKDHLWTNRQPGQVWRERFGPEYERFMIGEFYHLPWSDPWVRERFSQGTIGSKLSPEEMVDWSPQDLLYAPLRLADGRIVGAVSIDDPMDGRRPTKESLAPLELFLHQAAVAIENAKLIQQLTNARKQITEYAGQLELRVKQRTRELVETQNKLIKSERLAAIGELAAMVGHDLRNPLTGIAGATYYIKANSSPKLDKKSREMLDIIEEDIQRSNEIVNDLLEYSKEIKLEFSETTPKSVLKGALSLVEIPKNIQLKNSTRDTPRIRVDVEKISRVFINIIKNAVDAMPRGGTLTIRSKKSNDNVEFSFTDTGEGMTKCVLEKIWSPLFTTKAKGMGFGLSICKRIVEAHTGKVSVRSAIAKGSTFTITIPINPETDGGEQVWVNTPESLLSTTTKA
jgi:PAS domain S-box-containing protein